VSAQFVAFMFEQYQADLVERDPKRDPLATISIKLVQSDPGDIEYRYFVRDGVVTYQTASWGGYFAGEGDRVTWNAEAPYG
jgi:hypothetical protein